MKMLVNAAIIKRAMIVVGLSSLLLCFQNCGSGVEFSTTGTPKENKIVLLDEDEVNLGDDSSDPKEEIVKNDDSKMPKSPEDDSDKDHEEHANHEEDHDDDGDGRSCGDDRDDHDSSNKLYKCVIEHAGSSRAVHVANGQLSSDTSTVGLACMSRKACEEILAARLDAELSAKRFQPCVSNKHVIQISDEQALELDIDL